MTLLRKAMFGTPGWRAVTLAAIALAAAHAANITAALAQTGNFGFVLQRESANDFDEPEGLVLSALGTHLYVADAQHDVVRVLQPFTLETLTVISHRSLSSPRGIAIGDDKHLYVADTGNNRVVSYRVKHDVAEPIRTYQKDLDRPTGVARSRGRLYIANKLGNSIVVHEPGGEMQALNKAGDGPGEFRHPLDILVAPEGHIIVSDAGNNRIQILSQVLEPLKILHGKPYDFSNPSHMSLDEAGNLFVADSGNNRILVLDADFNVVGQIGTGQSGSREGRLNQPKGVAARNGHVWVSDTGNDRILHYRYSIR